MGLTAHVRIYWEDQQYVVTKPHYRATTMVGMTMAARNILQLLALKLPKERDDLWQALMEEGGRAGMFQEPETAGSTIPSVARPFHWWVEPQQRLIDFRYISGFIPNGTVQRGVIHGWFKVVIAAEDETEAVLKSVFNSSLTVS